jgi:hypothetical protein
MGGRRQDVGIICMRKLAFIQYPQEETRDVITLDEEVIGQGCLGKHKKTTAEVGR